jgi:hypothetical protein
MSKTLSKLSLSCAQTLFNQLEQGIPKIKLHTSFRVWSLSSLQLVSKMIENIGHNFTPISETVNKDNDDHISSPFTEVHRVPFLFPL